MNVKTCDTRTGGRFEQFTRIIVGLGLSDDHDPTYFNTPLLITYVIPLVQAKNLNLMMINTHRIEKDSLKIHNKRRKVDRTPVSGRFYLFGLESKRNLTLWCRCPHQGDAYDNIPA
ncbi:unnamed protein product [Nesidiocoris tenuis]|uniref:Uncharacterized protein n=1 Tax=Nesidiocoris tenuis TaxID=355587 RepID=A0A6H5HQP8_9HEMI|nr:unnamed protein product [Nesidiocoris tenuis]